MQTFVIAFLSKITVYFICILIAGSVENHNLPDCICCVLLRIDRNK